MTESFFTEGEELTNLKTQVSDLHQSRDSLQEQVRAKDEKIEKLVSTVLRSQYDFSLEQIRLRAVSLFLENRGEECKTNERASVTVNVMCER